MISLFHFSYFAHFKRIQAILIFFFFSFSFPFFFFLRAIIASLGALGIEFVQ
jgi:hypothetical protein